MSKGGRRVYRQGRYAKKQRLKKFFGWFFGIIALSALVFLGYCVAKPIYTYLNSENANITEDEPPWTPPVFTEAVKDDDKSPESDNEKDKQDNDSKEQEKEQAAKSFAAFELPADALLSEAKLSQTIAQAKSNGYTAVIAVMKAEGGKVYYKTSSTIAASDKTAVVGTLDASKIASIIKNNGMTALAYLNFLEDNNKYGESRDGSYHSYDGTTWLDNSVANGGKSWLSPFETVTQGYISQLTAEVTAADFDAVIAGGVRFPYFRNSDLNLIGDSVKSANRYQSLITAANISKSAATGNNKDFFLEVKASKIIDGTEEVFKPDKLKDTSLMVVYSPKELESTLVYNNHEVVLSELSEADKFAVIVGIISEKAGPDTKIIPLIKRDDYTQADFSDVVSALVDLGYKSYIIR